MAEPSPTDHPLARLILDYIRTLLWPSLIVWAFFLFQDDMLEILKTREVEVAGAFKVGQRVEDLAVNTQAELAELERMVAELKAAPGDTERVKAVTEAVSTSLEALGRNVNREVAQLRMEAAAVPHQAELVSAPAARVDSNEQAREFETQGFQQLIERNLVGAESAFTEAARLWPTYHNVSEIARLLRRSRTKLAENNEKAWSELYRTILSEYSWGMPPAVRESMEQAAGGRY